MAEMGLNSEQKQELLGKYRESNDKRLRNQVVMAYMNLVKYAAYSTRNMYAKYSEADDIVNEGVIALMAAVDSFDLSRGVKFETYASIKIRGAIIDYIRRQDIVPRTVRHFAKEYDAAYSELYARLDREPSDDEIADYMKLSKEKLESCAAKAAAAQTLSFEELVFDKGCDVPDEKAEDGLWQVEESVYKEEKKRELAAAIASLKEKEKLVITLYYYEKLKFAEIGAVIGVSESRVCQIHTRAVTVLKQYIAEHNKD